MLADNMVEEGIDQGIHVHTLQRDQHYHLTKMVHDHHDGVLAAVFWQVHDKVNVDLLPWGLQYWQWLGRPASLQVLGLLH